MGIVTKAVKAFRAGDVDRVRRAAWRRFSRLLLSYLFIKGRGIEVGALHLPLPVPPRAKVRYVDRMDEMSLRQQYPELNDLKLVKVDIIDNGEHLRTLSEASQDFVIANHFLEHCRNPLLTLSSHLRVLKPGGILYMAVPNKRHTFDKDRKLTPFEHVMLDFTEPSEERDRAHFTEYASCFSKDHQEIEAEAEKLHQSNYSIHYHVWDEVTFPIFLTRAGSEFKLSFSIIFYLENGHEIIAILRKGESQV